MKLNINPYLLVALLLCIATCASSQVLTLDSVLALIDRNNPSLKEYDNRVQALDAYAAGAKSWMAPMVGAGTFMVPYSNENTRNDADKGAWMLTVEQDIPNPAKLNANQNYLNSKAGVEKENRSIRFNALRSEAKSLYYQWLVAEEKVSVLQDNAKMMKLMLQLAHIRYPYSEGSLGNVYKAEGRLSEVENMLLTTHGEIEEKSYRLKSLANLPASDSIMIDTATVVSFRPVSVSKDAAILSEQRSDIRQIDQAIETVRLNQQLQKSQAKPDFRIRFDHMRPIGEMPSQFSAMVMVSIPIAPWSSRMYNAEVKGAHYEIEALKQSREAILTEARGTLSGIASRIMTMQQQLDNYRTKIIPALKKNYQTLMLAYEENREQLPIVIDGWEAMNMSQMEYLEKLEEYYTMIVRYEKETEQ